MKKSTTIERAGKTYIVSRPGYYFDECGQIRSLKKGLELFGCPQCGSSFVETCFCGFIKAVEPDDDADYMFQSAYDYNAKHNPSANY